MNDVKEKMDSRKLRGGYYTPKEITDFICKWAITRPTQKVLEPSCGDGNFIESAIERFLQLGLRPNLIGERIKGIEFVKSEAEKAKNRAAKFGVSPDVIANSDFFECISGADSENKYDVVVGNPPFIRYQNFPEKHRQKAFKMMQDMGLSPNKLTNIWVPFLVISANALNRYGKLAMVIPAELFQVKYAAESRIFLSNYFSRITIVTFKKLVFPDIQQEIVLLLCEKDTVSNPGIRVVELTKLDDLLTLDLKVVQNTEVKHLDHSSEKWTKYFLTNEEIKFLRKIKGNPNIHTCGDVMDVDVGLVTGRNEFFMLNEEQTRKWKLNEYVQKVVSKSNHFKGIFFNDEDFRSNMAAGNADNLFLPPNKDYVDLPLVCRTYISHGENLNYNTGYKCKIRKRWYITPSLWVPQAFALRQVGDYPKLILNGTDASSTDTIHRIKFKSDIEPSTLVVSFLNSLTFAFSEITGRSYGGGVLTFEPTEIEELPLPILKSNNLDLELIDTLIRQKKIEEVLDIVDAQLLIKQLKFTKKEVQMLRNIWKKLSDRRNKRNK